MIMRRLLGTVLPTLLPALLLAGVLAGCGDDEPAVTDGPGPTSTAPTSTAPTSTAPTKGTTGEPVDFELVEMITETGAGGSVEPGGAAVPLSDDVAVQEFTAQFSSDAISTQIQEAVDKTEVSDDMLLYGAVVAVGCDTPTDVIVTTGDQGLVITAEKVPSPLMECFAAMTTVALVLVPASAVS
jgi:hypothetical protein